MLHILYSIFSGVGCVLVHARCKEESTSRVSGADSLYLFDEVLCTSYLLAAHASENG